MACCLARTCSKPECLGVEETARQTEEVSDDSSVQFRDTDIHLKKVPGKLPEVKEGKCDSSLDPQGKVYIVWLLFVTMAFMYNSWVIPLRSAFKYQTSENVHKWMIFDYVSDFVYLIDLIFIKPRVMYLEDGFWIKDSKLMRIMYFRKLQFKLDVVSLTPLDLLCLKYGTNYLPFFRLPRLLKVQTFWEFYDRCDNVVASAYVVRVVRTLTYMLYLVHLNACAYYAFSAWEGLGSNNWVFKERGNAYIRCFYFATKTATSIGKNPKPGNEFEYMFMTWSWLMGVFVFALLIGQIRDIIATATRNQTEYRKLVDETLEYMRRLNLPGDLQEKVKLWFKFTWEQQHTFNESIILDTLPPKMKTDVAINVHIQSLNKVQIFHDCDPALLRELVLKLQPVLFLPGDYICRKGEVGRQMYIVKTGVVEVMGDDDAEVLATLREGSVFGEISLLSLGAGNRRTASVRSRGFSNLFILSKSDLNEALVHYPDAQLILKNKAEMLMRENAERERLNRLREQSEQSDECTEESTEESISGEDDLHRDLDKSASKSSLTRSTYSSKLNQLLTTTTWLTTIVSVASITNPLQIAPVPQLNVSAFNDVRDKKNNTFQCNVTVHKETG
ncbi:UNVERIFIED_CONTAM: hypothetical protein PYX00_006544 [Menopon gallinae]|uniref:Cyclic nucleotide-binding domain-containing protein n=1 Tax=Menopon gallinae TaxID=328185 RepID=A0AAW2HVM8_9NEOP